MRFFVAKCAPQNDRGFLVAWELWWRFALDAFFGVGGIGKAAAEPPHSTMGWAYLQILRLR
jgi:hypothetical protein